VMEVTNEDVMEVTSEDVVEVTNEAVMEEANESHHQFGCVSCLSTTWGLVKLVIYCRCRTLGRLIFPPPRPFYTAEHDEEVSEDIEMSVAGSGDLGSCGGDPETSIHSTPRSSTQTERPTRVRFRSTPEIFLIPWTALTGRNCCQ